VFAREVEGTGAEIVAFTGTNGKSTTTALAGHVLQAAGRNAEIGGNIGTAAFLLSPPLPRSDLCAGAVVLSDRPDAEPQAEGRRAAQSVSRSPRPAWHDGGLCRGQGALFARQGPGDTAVVSVDDAWCEAIRQRAERPPHGADLGGAHPRGRRVRARRRAARPAGGRTVDEIDLAPMRALRGQHNWQNACAAYAAARAVGLDGDAIARAMASFPGLAHRMQEVGRIGPVAFINDSKATNVESAARALAAFDTIYWIAGGRPKSGGIAALSPYFGKIARAYLIGEAAEEFARTLHGQVDTVVSATLDQAVVDATADALAEGRPGAVVLLSPACASFDQFTSFEVRGEAFCAAVRALEGFQARKGEAAPC
jgi:UDP-N-acetylmuramoylalanine--D-glutamate ligase